MIKIWSHWSELKKWSELTGVETFCQCDRIDEVSPAENADDLRVQVAQADLLQHFEGNWKEKKRTRGQKFVGKFFLSFGTKPCCAFDGTSAHMVESSTRLVEVTGSNLSNARKTFFAVSCVCLDGHLIFLWSVVTFIELVQLHNSAFKQQANVIVLRAQWSLFWKICQNTTAVLPNSEQMWHCHFIIFIKPIRRLRILDRPRMVSMWL